MYQTGNKTMHMQQAMEFQFYSEQRLHQQGLISYSEHNYKKHL